MAHSRHENNERDERKIDCKLTFVVTLIVSNVLTVRFYHLIIGQMFATANPAAAGRTHFHQLMTTSIMAETKLSSGQLRSFVLSPNTNGTV